MTDTVDRAEMIALTRAQCLECLQAGGIGVVAFDRGYGPELLPVTFAADADTLLFRTGISSRLAREADGQLVAFETHGLEPALHDGWSVVVRGVAAVAPPAGESLESSELTVHPWAPGEHGIVITISLTLAQLTGRKLTSAEPS
jgi:nitroimidazol reductase NimA-like FMN-containing flavoprotein (pyridoxamine 5'-phosphate oxidase superfamily)